MPKIITANEAPAVATAPGAHHYRLVGLEIRPAAELEIQAVLAPSRNGYPRQ